MTYAFTWVGLLIGALFLAMAVVPSLRITPGPTCDDCTGRPACPCADGRTHPETCTCGGTE